MRMLGVSCDIGGISDKNVRRNPRAHRAYKLRVAGDRNLDILRYCVVGRKMKCGRMIPTRIVDYLRALIREHRICLKPLATRKVISYSVYELMTDARKRPYVGETSLIQGLQQLHNVVPPQIGVEIDKIIRACEHYDFHIVKQITRRGTAKVYDISVDGNENFVLSSGCVYAHNSASRRLSKIDLQTFPQSKDYVRGSIENDEAYYTNSVHLRPDADVDLITRIRSQAMFHDLIESGAIIHAFVGESQPSAKAIESLVTKTFHNSHAAQLTISPEFTICRVCGGMSIGIVDKCKSCGSFDIGASREDPSTFHGSKWSLETLQKMSKTS
jgi:hypothetical protein